MEDEKSSDLANVTEQFNAQWTSLEKTQDLEETLQYVKSYLVNYLNSIKTGVKPN